MAKKKEEKPKPKLKPITYKFIPKGGGKVVLKGLSSSEEELPSEIGQVLNAHGFNQESEYDSWLDGLAPGNMSLDEDLETISSIVPVKIVTNLKLGKTVRWLQPSRMNKAICFAEIDGSGLCRGKDICDALVKAHKEWNREGRPVNGVRLETAMRVVLQEINAKRG